MAWLWIVLGLLAVVDRSPDSSVTNERRQGERRMR